MSDLAYIGLDQGSSNSKSILVSAEGKVIGTFSEAVSTNHLNSLEIEQDPEELCASVRSVLEQALSLAKSESLEVDAIGLACQRSGVLAWQADTKNVIHPLLSWRDTRTNEFLESKDGARELVWQKTGLPLSAHYTAGKISLLQSKFPEDSVRIATLDTYLVEKLFGSGGLPFHTEDTMAHRSMLYSFEEGGWDPELCDLFEVEASRLPSIGCTLDYHGSYRGIPLSFLSGDQQAGLFTYHGSECQGLLSLGTSALLAVQTSSLRTDIQGYIPSILYSHAAGDRRDVHHLIEGTVNFSRRTFDEVSKRTKLSIEEIMSRYAQARNSQKVPIAYCPFGSTSSPDWTFGLPNVVTEWDREDELALSFALLENFAFSLVMHLNTFLDTGVLRHDQVLPVAGGYTHYKEVLQCIADVSGISLGLSDQSEVCAYGAAFGAAAGRGSSWSSGRGVEFVDVVTSRESVSSKRFREWWFLREKVRTQDIPTGAATLEN